MNKKVGLSVAVLLIVCMVSVLLMFFQDSSNSIDKTKPLNNSISEEIFNKEKIKIEQKINAENNKTWLAKFNISILRNQITVEVLIELLSEQSVSGFELGKVKESWLAAIDEKYNNRFDINLFSQKLPLVFDVKFSSYSGHHRVIVANKVVGIDTHHWYIDMPPNLAAHEFGHFIGAFDEYKKGAISNKTEIYKGSLMGMNTKNGEIFPRHLKLIESKLSEILSTKAVVSLQMENEYEN